MKVLIASSSLLAKPALDYLVHSKLSLVGALTMPDAPKGRGREISENDFAKVCRDAGLAVYKPENNDELLQVLSNTGAELVVTIAYGRLIRARELVKPQHGWLNIHFSLLPRWRGAAPAQRSIEAGDERTGVTVFKLDEGLDTGPIYSTSEYEMRGDETSSILLERLAALSVEPLKRALQMIADKHPASLQSDNGATIARKLSKSEGEIDWSEESQVIERKIRAFTPWPTAWTNLDDSRISILSARCVKENLLPGEISTRNDLVVGCGEGALQILSLKPEGKRAMSAAEWIRGARLTANAKFQ